MRAIISYFALIAIFVWLASEGGFDRAGSGALPIANSRAPTHFSDLPLPDPHALNDLAVVPAAQASEPPAGEVLYVTGAVVNLRAGPGLEHRMITVAERGDVMRPLGRAENGWLPVRDLVTGGEAWISEEYLSLLPPLR